MQDVPHVVIVGGGFGGLSAARALRRAPVRITLVDRRNHHLFQPLLYQVATAALSPADITAPIRGILRRQRNLDVRMAEVADVDTGARDLVLADGARLAYDFLVVATGATHAYFGHPEWAPLAPGLKTIEDATEIRRRFLLAFEAAEQEEDPRSGGRCSPSWWWAPARPGWRWRGRWRRSPAMPSCATSAASTRRRRASS
jgi:NADH:ubiquinone reductase (H+-translocating)